MCKRVSYGVLLAVSFFYLVCFPAFASFDDSGVASDQSVFLQSVETPVQTEYFDVDSSSSCESDDATFSASSDSDLFLYGSDGTEVLQDDLSDGTVGEDVLNFQQGVSSDSDMLHYVVVLELGVIILCLLKR